MKNFIYTGLLFCVSVMISLIASELILRQIYIIPGNIPEEKLSRKYPLHFGFAGRIILADQLEFSIEMRYNRHGFRNDEFPENKNDQEVRFLFLGDSFVEGWGVAKKDRFSERLIKKLIPKSNKKITLVNIGQLATQPIHYFRNLIDFGMSFRPDFVICGIYIGNDVMGGRSEEGKLRRPFTINTTFPLQEKPKPNLFGFFVLKRIFLETLTDAKSTLERRVMADTYWEVYWRKKINKNFFLSKLALEEKKFDTLVSSLDARFLKASLAGKLNPGYLIQAISNRLGKKDETDVSPYYNELDFLNVFETISEIARVVTSTGAQFLIVIIPDIDQVEPKKFRAFLKNIMGFQTIPHRLQELKTLKERLTLNLKKAQIPFVDITQILKEAREPVFHLMDQHLNAKGHQLMAEAIYKKISKNFKPQATQP